MSPQPSRRALLKTAAAAAPAFLHARMALTNPLNMPIGLQLYTVGKEMDSDPAGTLKRVAQIGYKNVEVSPLAKTPANELKKMLADNGLKSPSGHYMLPDLLNNFQQKVDLAKGLGQEAMVITVPWVADPARFKSNPSEGQLGMFLAVIRGMTLDDWKWNAEQFNKVGEKTKQAGLQLGYHNHNFEFKSFGDTTGYDEFLRLTDPNLVKLELDCGWMTVAGYDPVTYLNQYPNRYEFLHVKDFRKGFKPTTTLMEQGPNAPVPTELGRGAIDYRPMFAAAKKANIRAYYVEQEPPFQDMPALEAIQVDYDYLKNLHS